MALAGCVVVTPRQPSGPGLQPERKPFAPVPEMSFRAWVSPDLDGPVSNLRGLYGEAGPRSQLLSICRLKGNRLVCSRLAAVLDATGPLLVEVTGEVAGDQLAVQHRQPLAWDQVEQEAMARAKLDAIAPLLATYDWSQIARADFAESSASFHPAPETWAGVPIELAAYDSAGDRIVWRAVGPLMPKQKELVFRYPVVYLATDPAGDRPTEAYVTIEGHVEE